MENKGVYIIAKKFNGRGCIAYRCKNNEEIRGFPELFKEIREEGVQLVILNSPEIYSEYAPYTYVEDREEFLSLLSRLGCKTPEASTLSTHSYFENGDSVSRNKSAHFGA